MSTVATAHVYGAGCSARRSRADRRAEARHTAFDDGVAGVGSERLRQPADDVPYEVGRVPVEAIDPLREVQRLLDLPDLVVPVGRQDARRVTDGHPSDRHHGARLKPRAQVDRGVHSHFAARPNTAPWKIAASVATNTSSSSVAPVTCALGPMHGCLALARMTAFSMMIPSRPIRMAPPASPTRRAPCRTRTPGPIVTLPHSVASGATQAIGSIVGRFPACSISIVSLSSRLAASWPRQHSSHAREQTGRRAAERR